MWKNIRPQLLFQYISNKMNPTSFLHIIGISKQLLFFHARLAVGQLRKLSWDNMIRKEESIAVNCAWRIEEIAVYPHLRRFQCLNLFWKSMYFRMGTHRLMLVTLIGSTTLTIAAILMMYSVVSEIHTLQDEVADDLYEFKVGIRF